MIDLVIPIEKSTFDRVSERAKHIFLECIAALLFFCMGAVIGCAICGVLATFTSYAISNLQYYIIIGCGIIMLILPVYESTMESIMKFIFISSGIIFWTGTFFIIGFLVALIIELISLLILHNIADDIFIMWAVIGGVLGIICGWIYYFIDNGYIRISYKRKCKSW